MIERTPLLDMTVQAWERVIKTDLTGVFVMTQPVARGMVERGGGKVINVCSMMSELGRDSVGAYAAAKGGLKMLTRSMATEWGRHGVQVNGIGPGYFATSQTAPLRQDGHPFNDWIVSRTPAGRWGDPTTSLAPPSSWPRPRATSSTATSSTWTAASWRPSAVPKRHDAAAAPAPRRAGGARCQRAGDVRVENPTDAARADEVVSVRWDALARRTPGLAADRVRATDADGAEVPVQAFDGDGDGTPDDLLLLVSLWPGQSRDLRVEAAPSAADRAVGHTPATTPAATTSLGKTTASRSAPTAPG